MSTRSRVPVATKAAFGVGQLAEGVKNFAFNIFLLFYYNQVLGLSGTLAGLALLVATTFDAVTDPLAGSFSDRLHHRWGRRHPFMYASALPLAASFALLFAPPEGLEGTGLFLWLTGFAVAVRASMTLFHVPHLALGAELSDDYDERTTIAATRTAFSLVGGAAVVAGGWLWFFRETPEFASGQLNPAAYPAFGLCFAAVMGVTILVSALGTHDRIPTLPRPEPRTQRFTLRELLGDYAEALRNPSFRAFFLGIVVFFVTRGIQEVLGVHMFTFFWRLEPGEIGAVGLAALPGLVLGVPFWARASARLDKGRTFVIGISVFSAMILGPVAAKIAGVFPAQESFAYLGILLAASGLAAFGVAAALVLAGSMMADVADEHELVTGRRQEGIFFAALSFGAKSTSGLGTFLGGLGLDLIGFPAQASPETVPESTATALGVLYGPGIAVLAVVAIALLARYRLDRARHAEVRAELLRRRRDRGDGQVRQGDGR